MADINLNVKQTVSPKILQRTILLGRMKMAQAIKMAEPEWAKIISDVEKDPLVQELLSSTPGRKQIIQYKRYGRSRLSGQFYELNEGQISGGQGESPESLLNEKKGLINLIKKVGQENFEKYFLYRDVQIAPPKIAQSCGITANEAQQIQDFILDMSVKSEFYHPSSLGGSNAVKPTLVGKIMKNEDGRFSVSFFSPHLARGQYQIDHMALKDWQKGKKLNRQQSSKLRKFVGLLELANLKQGAFWRVMDYLLVLQQDYFESRDYAKMAPVSLRKVARHLQFAPSTISRVMGNKSVLLPWDEEIMIMDLMPGQRKVVLEILEKILENQTRSLTDVQLSKLLADEHGVTVSRRTITACRHIIQKRHK